MNDREQPKAAIALSERIVADALRRHGGPVWALPNERRMTCEYGVGRETVRQALRLLEFQGVVEVRPGKGGGATMIRPATSSLANPLTLLMQLHRTPYRAVVIEARLLMEPIIARLAARRRDHACLDELSRAIDQMRRADDDLASYSHAYRRFHVTLATATGNALLECLLDSLFCIPDGGLRNAVFLKRRADALQDHVEIQTALSVGDPAATEQAVRSHLDAEASAAREQTDLLNRPIVWTSSQARPVHIFEGKTWTS